MKTIIMLTEYDGTNYFGWQVQPNKKTIQGELNKAIRKAFNFKPEKNNSEFEENNSEFSIIGSGRTDSGVHASGQICHFRYNEIKIPNHKVRLAINQKLPLDIRVKRVWFTDLDFHSRFDAHLREYKYRFSRHTSVFNRRFISFVPYKLDINLLFQAAKLVEGRHNFFTFSKNHSQIPDYYCEIQKCEWIMKKNGVLELTVTADRFVYGMIRGLVGTMIDISRKKRDINCLLEGLKTPDRTLCSALAPAFGLDLHHIYYKFPFDCLNDY